MIKQLTIVPPRQGLFEITAEVNGVIREAGVDEGLCTLFVQHTSASLLIQENADPDARHDLEQWLNRLVPINDPAYTHVNEGPDDMPSHIKSSLTNTTLAIPVMNGRAALGTWQGIFLWEHRHNSSQRHIVVHVHGDR
jgi:secondary thiamine-phosphate synthase enzyme